MINVKFFLVTYDKVLDRVIENLDSEEKDSIVCYTVQKSVQKQLPSNLKILNEWELDWNDYSFQQKQWYEYGSFVHLLNNYEHIEELTHIGILHYDVLFNKNSINNLKKQLEENESTIFYNRIRYYDELYLSPYELYNICEFMNKKLDMSIDYQIILNNGWISECLSVVPIEVFKKFAKFLSVYRTEIEDILVKNMWGIMNVIPHRICGIVERMWGIYLVSQKANLQKFQIEHDWDFYTHKHHQDANWILTKK